MHQMEAVSSRQHMPGLQQRVYFVSTPTPPPSSSLPPRCWFPFCCICIFTHTNRSTHTRAKAHTCTDRNPVAKRRRGNYFTSDWAHSSVTPSEKCACVLRQKRNIAFKRINNNKKNQRCAECQWRVCRKRLKEISHVHISPNTLPPSCSRAGWKSRRWPSQAACPATRREPRGWALQ